MISFGSDNHGGAHPEVLRAIEQANAGAAPAYGGDDLTARAKARLRELFQCPEMEVLFTFSGSGANVLSLACLLGPTEAVLCADVAHLHVDEACAPERLLGAKVVPLPTREGKISPESLRPYRAWIGHHHSPQPRALSLTQATEYGTVYTPAELRALRDAARAHGMKVHIDGARLSNALAAAGGGWADLLADSGAAAISLGGTKNGLLFGEAVLLFPPLPDRDLLALQKQTLQQASKMRFIAAQFLAFFEDDLWLRSARHANAMAQELAAILRRFPQARVTCPVDANAVFAAFPPGWADELLEEFLFYPWDPLKGEHRLMCSFATRPEDLAAFAAALERLAAREG